MLFDVVIGNPPYNKGMDLDFINIGFELCAKYCCMITPAKWQTAANEYRGCASKTIDYKQFREKLVSHMAEVVFYPDALDVFAVAQNDGITYFLLDKQNKYEKCKVVNKSILQKHANSVSIRDIRNRQSLWNIGQEIVEYIKHKPFKKFEFTGIDVSHTYKVNINAQMCNGLGASGRYDWDAGGIKKDAAGTGGLLFNANGMIQLLSSVRILKISEVSSSAASKDVFSADTIEECNSFVSWVTSKLVRFMILINISKMNGILTDDYFRFVPSPHNITSGNTWDHIYTDEEIYKSVGLTEKYIDIIESIIKDRKQVK